MKQKSLDYIAVEDEEPLLTMSKTEGDPFYTVRDNVNSQLERLKIKNDKFQDMVKNTDTSSNAEFKDLRKTLAKDIRTTEKDIKGLRDAVKMIEKNRVKFPHIMDNELDGRKQFVEDAHAVLSEIKSAVESPAVRRKLDEDESKNQSRGYVASTATSTPAQEARTAENSNFVRDQQQQTQQLIARQDQNVEVLGESVDRLGQIARNINQEVNEQNVMLDSLETEVEQAGDKMNTVQGQLQKLLRTKDNCQIWTVVILTFILVLLIALVIWT